MIDILFIHVPKETKNINRCMLMPLGVLTLADFLNRKGFRTRVLHYIIEKYLKKDFSIINFINKHKVKLTCIDLHWHYQIYDVLKIAKRIKKECNTKIVLGGFTATFFAKDIMKGFPEIDFIIKGDSELPLLKLIGAVNRNCGYKNIPNLIWRKKSKIISNQQTYITSKKVFDCLFYSNFNLLKNHRWYLNSYARGDNDVSREEMFKLKEKVFHYNVGRGCSVNCSFCGGSNTSQQILNKRKGMILKSYKSAIRDLKKLNDFEINYWYTCFDPMPKRDYYFGLFKAIRKNRIKLNCIFECWSLPTIQFINEFKKTFLKDSVLVISPETGSENIRKINKGFFYLNKDLIKTLDHIAKNNIKAKLYFTFGLPFETKKDLLLTKKLIKKIKSLFKNEIKILVFPIEIEPCAPWTLNPGKWKIKLDRVTFQDYYYHHRKNDFADYSESNFDLGYESMYLSKKEILDGIKGLRRSL